MISYHLILCPCSGFPEKSLEGLLSLPPPPDDDTRTDVSLHQLSRPGLVWTPLGYLDMPVAVEVLELVHGPLVDPSLGLW